MTATGREPLAGVGWALTRALSIQLNSELCLIEETAEEAGAYLDIGASYAEFRRIDPRLNLGLF
jgi:hypothetical protein